MADWRSQVTRTEDRQSQLSGKGANQGIFQAFIDTSTGETQSGKFIYAGGERSIALPMPFESSTSWIRCIPEGATPALASYRADTGDTVCLGYMINNPKEKLSAYEGKLNVYRPILPGEIEISSRGGAQSYYTARPVLEQRAGAVRHWIDQDRLEVGAKSPLHTRQLYDHKSNSTGDEERFGVVKRPYNFLFDPLFLTPRNFLTAILALSDKSYNYYDYPVPGATTPAGVADIFSPRAIEAGARATAPALELIGQFKIRPYAKEYLKVITNPLFPVSPNSKLLDIREGQVFDDKGLQVIGTTGAFLRARYQYYTPALDATEITIDEVGNMQTSFSIGALQGWSVSLPTGPFSMKALLQGISFFTGNNFDIKSALATGISALTSINMESGLNMSITNNVPDPVSLESFSHTMRSGNHSVSVLTGNSKTSVGLNLDLEAKVNFTAVALAGKAAIKAPFVDIGGVTPPLQPLQPMLLGTNVALWLRQLLTALKTAAPIGNVGAPVPFGSDIAFVASLAQLEGLIDSLPIAGGLKSATVKVSP